MGSRIHETTRSVHSDAPRVSATHEFTIRNYSRTKGIGIGQPIYSGNFTVDDREWNIEFYPDGYSFFDWRDPALFARLVRMPVRPLQAAVKFQLIDPRNGAGKVLYGVNLAVATFDYNAYSWGLRRFISRKRLEGADLGALHDDSITVRCTVSVLKPEARVALLGNVEVPVPPSCFAENAARFLATGRAPFDVKFNVGGVVLEAHRLVLASQSPWFDSLLYGHWGDTRVVEIGGTSPEVFKAVLHYIYNDQLPDGATADEAATRQLFVAADMYLLERLKKMCASRLCRFLEDGTVESIMQLAEAHSCIELQQACKSYMARRKNGLSIERSN
ncbi:hypothetical protein ACQ4PT_024585 [Festuca glaucescens]